MADTVDTSKVLVGVSILATELQQLKVLAAKNGFDDLADAAIVRWAARNWLRTAMEIPRES